MDSITSTKILINMEINDLHNLADLNIPNRTDSPSTFPINSRIKFALTSLYHTHTRAHADIHTRASLFRVIRISRNGKFNQFSPYTPSIYDFNSVT